jgi:histidine ammonia-lyase
VNRGRIVIDGESLSCDDVKYVARDATSVIVAPDGVARARAAWEVALEVAADQPVYGRTTGVGANRLVTVEWDDADAHGLRLLRSHAAGAGPPLAPEIVRAMLVVRLNQLAGGGSGVGPGVLGALAEALNRGAMPPVPRYGAIGTGDLTALAATALCLLGERSWNGPGPLFPLPSSDALAFISSNAATLLG